MSGSERGGRDAGPERFTGHPHPDSHDDQSFDGTTALSGAGVDAVRDYHWRDGVDLDGAESFDAESFDAESLDAESHEAAAFDAESHEAAAFDPDDFWPEVSVELELQWAAQSPATPATVALLRDTAASQVGGRSMVHGVLACQRLIDWAQAQQQRWIASLARPGVAAPMEDLIDLAQWGTRTPGEVSLGPDSRLGSADPDDPLPRPRIGDPMVDAVLAGHAARLTAAELGCALHLSPLSARYRVENALALVDRLPKTLDAHQRGDIDGVRARIIVDGTVGLDQAQRRRVEAATLPTALRCTPGRLRSVVARNVAIVDPDGAEDRAQRRHHQRDVRIRPDTDNRAQLCADLAADQARTALRVLNLIADSLDGECAAGRGVGELRADAFTDIFDGLATTGRVDITSLLRPAADGPDSTRSGEPGPGQVPDTATDPAFGPTPDSESAGTPCPPFDLASDLAFDPTPGPVPDPAASTASDTAPSTQHQPTRSNGARRDPANRRVVAPREPVCLNVYAWADTLARLNDLPGEIVGHGMVTAEFVRDLARSANSIRAISVHPTCDHRGCTGGLEDTGDTADAKGPKGGAGTACGTRLDFGRAVYRPPAAVADHVIAEHRTCRFPGCRRSAVRCDIDHRIPFDDGGSTCPCNLQPLCRRHHLGKTFTGWSIRPGPGGAFNWTSPLGNIYTDDPGHLLLGLPTAEPVSAAGARPDATGSDAGLAMGDAGDPPPF